MASIKTQVMTLNECNFIESDNLTSLLVRTGNLTFSIDSSPMKEDNF